MVGLDVFGYRSLNIQDIPGLEYYHIDMKKGGEFMRSKKKNLDNIDMVKVDLLTTKNLKTTKTKIF